ncbi:hypothetical protein [Streptosporangium sp. NPDC048865]|uniref:hypothetical protein n=1 Tax=Streptosporangium sp. NPDC048865 TaxID=3155766 RepID=UPI0034484411
MASIEERRPLLVPEEMGPYAALAEEWCKRKIAESPRWSAEKWQRIAAIHSLEYADNATDLPAELGRSVA